MVKHGVADDWGGLDWMEQSHERFDPRIQRELFESDSGS
jgi:hypothetical protein